MRALLTAFVFLAGIAAVVLVHAPRAHAGWERPQRMDVGYSPKVRLLPGGRLRLAHAKGDPLDPSRIVVGEGNEPLRRLRVPRAGRLSAFDVDDRGGVVALREDRRAKRLHALVAGRWRRVSTRRGNPVDARLAVAPSGAAAAAWLEYGARHGVGVHVALRGPGADRFQPARRISGPVLRRDQPLSVAVDDAGEAVVTFADQRDLWMWRPGRQPVRVHDAPDGTSSRYTATAAVRGGTAVVAFTRLVDHVPPEFELSVATQAGDGAPVTEKVAEDVSSLDIVAAVDDDGAPLALSTPIGPPYSLRLYRRGATWAEHLVVPATGAPSTVVYEDGAVAWTEGLRGFAWFAGEKLALGRAYEVDVAVETGRALAVWDRGPRRALGIAGFTP